MKAVRIQTFGGSEVLQVEDVARPVPAPDEILVKVVASGVNPVDWGIRKGSNDAMRSLFNLPLTLGWDAAGVVAEVGSAVSGLQKGDAVYGVPNFPGDGSYAEYCAAKASQFALRWSSQGGHKNFVDSPDYGSKKIHQTGQARLPALRRQLQGRSRQTTRARHVGD